MRLSEYCSHDEVQGFVRWAVPLVSGERPFSHQWHSPKWGGWSCRSIGDAYLHFRWPFSVTLPGQTSQTTGKSFQENAAVLGYLSHLLRESAASNHQQKFVMAASAVVNRRA